MMPKVNALAEDREFIKATMGGAYIVAAQICEKVTQREVEAARAGAVARGATIQQAATIDRASVAATLLKLAAEGKGPYAL